MKLAITGWRTQVASDLVRDGLGVELLNAAGDVVAEVFRGDVDGAMTLNTFNNPLPVDVVDHGTLTDNNGRKSDFRNVIIVMTTNAGAETMNKATIGFTNPREAGDEAARMGLSVELEKASEEL